MTSPEVRRTASFVRGGYAEDALEVRDVFRCHWTHDGSVSGGQASHVLPDACADIVVDETGDAVLVGPTMTPHRFDVAASTRLRGLRLQPWSIPLLFRATAGELRDRVLPLDSLLPGSSAAGVAEQVWVGEAPSLWNRVDTSPWQLRLVQRLLHAPSGAVEDVGRAGGVSERHARRAMRDLTGLAPQELARVGRLQRLLPALDDEGWPLAELAFQHGYADQAHLSRDLKRLTGSTPAILRSERSGRPAATGTPLRRAAELITRDGQ